MLTVVTDQGYIHTFKTTEYRVVDNDLHVETEHGLAVFGAGSWAWAVPGPSAIYTERAFNS